MKNPLNLASMLLCATVSAWAPPAAAYHTIHKHRLHRREALSLRAYFNMAPQSPPAAAPDWTVQYGVVKGGASGSLGAMLEGRNPSANSTP